MAGKTADIIQLFNGLIKIDPKQTVWCRDLFGPLHDGDSLLFVGYLLSWPSLVQLNHKIKRSTNKNFSWGLYDDFSKTEKFNIHEYVHENW